MFPSKFLQFPSILTHFHAANEKIQNGGRDLAISRGLVWVLRLGLSGHRPFVKYFPITMTSSNRNISRVTVPLWGEPNGDRWNPVAKARGFDVFLDPRLNKRLSKQSRHRWFETQSRSFWRHSSKYFPIFVFKSTLSVNKRKRWN